jgi:predicted CoA-binding protein
MSGPEQMALMRRLLATSRRIAVVGASDRPERDSHRIFRYLQAAGYDVVPVNPQVGAVAGVAAVPDLASAGHVDLVDVFRRSEHVPQIVEEVIATAAPALWLQLGVIHEAATRRAREAGVEVVENACIMVAHRLMFG